MDPKGFLRFMKASTATDRAHYLNRLEFLAEFVMASPECARTDEQSELWRRIELLRATFLETTSADLLTSGHVDTDPVGEEVPF
jgi:hypothetical protein